MRSCCLYLLNRLNVSSFNATIDVGLFVRQFLCPVLFEAQVAAQREEWREPSSEKLRWPVTYDEVFAESWVALETISLAALTVDGWPVLPLRRCFDSTSRL
jgi:hypothetical protein